MPNLTIDSAKPGSTLTRKINKMNQIALLTFLLVLLAGPAAHGQINCNNASTAGKLSCLIPSTVTSGAPSGYRFSNSSPNPLLQNSFGFLTSDLGGELSQIPLASPASGVIFSIDPALKVPVPSDQSLGPILTQRADTIGKHKVYVATTYQYFLLEDVDGLGLQGLPVSAFYLDSPGASGPDTLAAVNSRIDLKIHQYVGYVTFGLTDNIDVSAAVPVLRVDMRYTINERLYDSNGNPVTTSNGTKDFVRTNAGESTGIGDIVLAFKEEAWKSKHAGLAFGAELRLPTGDAENFLGSGTFGIKPFITLTRSGKISPHLNVGYQLNGTTELATDSMGRKTGLPDRLLYSGGADWGIAKRLTIAADVLEQRVFGAPRATVNSEVTPFSGTSSLTLSGVITSVDGSYNRTDGSIGIKLKPFGNMIVTGNLLVKLDRNGLRQRLAPLMGLSFTY
jgi:hypothetical protein